MVPMPAPTTVWMVALDRGPDDVKGSLALHPDRLVFVAEGEQRRFPIPLAQIRNVKRVLGSPVMVVHWSDEGTRRSTAFYFTKPPALHSQLQTRNEIPPTLIGPFNRSGQPSRRKTRKKNVSYLTMASTSVKDDIKTWVREIRVAVTHARNAQPGP
jgi:hypothetical protein